MIRTRVARTLCGDGRSLADGIVGELVRFDQMGRGTVMVGTGDTAMLRGDEPRPHVIVPLAWYRRPNAVGRDQIARADAVVLIASEEVALIPGGIMRDCLVVTMESGVSESVFLRGASPYELVTAADVLAMHPALSSVLPRIPSPGDARRRLTRAAVDAAIEALVAARDADAQQEPSTFTRG